MDIIACLALLFILVFPTMMCSEYKTDIRKGNVMEIHDKIYKCYEVKIDETNRKT